jgi:hypothetical protein
VRNGRAVQMNAHASGRLNGRTGRLGHEELLLQVSVRYYNIIAYFFNK